MLHNSVLTIIYKIIQYLNKKSSLASIKSFITDIAMGKITTADAVLLIHVLIKTVARATDILVIYYFSVIKSYFASLLESCFQLTKICKSLCCSLLHRLQSIKSLF